MIAFDIGNSGQLLQFANCVLSHLDQHRQTRFWHREAGGLLFARLELPNIEVCEATGPRRTDRRTRYSYWPDARRKLSKLSTGSRATCISWAVGTPTQRTMHRLLISTFTIFQIVFAARIIPSMVSSWSSSDGANPRGLVCFGLRSLLCAQTIPINPSYLGRSGSNADRPRLHFPNTSSPPRSSRPQPRSPRCGYCRQTR